MTAIDELRALVGEQEDELQIRTLRSLSYELMGLSVCSDEGPAKTRFRRQANAVRWAVERLS